MPISPDRFTAPSGLTARNDVYPFIDPSNFRGKLEGKVVAIAGAGRGIGKTAAFAFADAGANIACISRTSKDVSLVAEEIRKTFSARNVKAIAVTGDISIPEQHDTIVTDVTSQLGDIDILLNCAGVTRFGAFAAEQGMASWWRVLQINLLGTVGMTHAVLQSMLSRGSGIIINVTSTSGSQDIPFNTAYATSKAAVIKFTQDLHAEVGNKGISVFSVHPGTVETGLASTAEALNMSEDSLKHYPEMGKLFEDFQKVNYQTPELAAQTFVALAVREDSASLSGLYIDSQCDLGEVLSEANKEDRGKIGRENLYKLKMEQL
ncbi:hypothetical protein MMC10_002882 [Thelotrema lepadinum]|nr:hypothetical protein [Thelotrema lepadinum]